MQNKLPTVLTIAGSDCSGGAGVQADIKTITAHKVYAMSVITALTAQNTQGVLGVEDTTPEFVAKQIDAVYQDIVPDAVKIGMVADARIIEVIAHKLTAYQAKNIVLDPVMIASSGGRLIEQDAEDVLIKRLLPVADIITPNIAEATVFCNGEVDIHDEESMEEAAAVIGGNVREAKKALGSKWGHITILMKGGHLAHSASDLVYMQTDTEDGERIVEKAWITAERVQNFNTHGTGCTLSSAIACNLAKGYGEVEAVKRAKGYLTGALKAHLDLGKGSGPLDHMYWLTLRDE